MYQWGFQGSGFLRSLVPWELGHSTSPFPQPEETGLQVDVLWGINQINPTSVTGGVKKESFAALAPGAQSLQLLSWRHLSLAKIHGWKWWKPLHEALQLFSRQEDGTRLLVPVTVLWHCCAAVMSHLGTDIPEPVRWACSCHSFQSFWFHLPYRRGLWNVSVSLLPQSPVCTGRQLMWGESCLLEMTSLVGDIPGVGWACASLW